MAVPPKKRKAAQEASKKIALLGSKPGQRGGSRKHPPADKKNPFPPLSEVLKMEEFSVLSIMDSEEQGVEEDIRVNDECVFRNATSFLEG
jgi:hypothetical protein